MSNWIAAPLAILFFVGFIWFMSNRKKLVNQAKEKLGMEVVEEAKKPNPQAEAFKAALEAKKNRKPVPKPAPAAPEAPAPEAEKAGE